MNCKQGDIALRPLRDSDGEDEVLRMVGRHGSGLSEGLGAGAEARIKFKFDCFNPRRAMRGAEAASVVVDDPDDPEGPCMLWMSKSDVGRNMMAFGRDPALVQAWDAYVAYEKSA